MNRNIFESWVVFREKRYGDNRTDLLSIINKKNGSNLTSAAITQYCSGSKAVPDNILRIVESDFELFIPWLLTRSGLVFTDKSAQQFAKQIRFPIKRK